LSDVCLSVRSTAYRSQFSSDFDETWHTYSTLPSVQITGKNFLWMGPMAVHFQTQRPISRVPRCGQILNEGAGPPNAPMGSPNASTGSTNRNQNGEVSSPSPFRNHSWEHRASAFVILGPLSTQ